MKLAVEASAQIEGGHPIDMEIVPASRAPCSGYEKYGNDEGN
jgi:hypothetical protein